MLATTAADVVWVCYPSLPCPPAAITSVILLKSVVYTCRGHVLGTNDILVCSVALPLLMFRMYSKWQHFAEESFFHRCNMVQGWMKLQIPVFGDDNSWNKLCFMTYRTNISLMIMLDADAKHPAWIRSICLEGFSWRSREAIHHSAIVDYYYYLITVRDPYILTWRVNTMLTFWQRVE